jgi:hypothetical protein
MSAHIHDETGTWIIEITTSLLYGSVLEISRNIEEGVIQYLAEGDKIEVTLDDVQNKDRKLQLLLKICELKEVYRNDCES